MPERINSNCRLDNLPTSSLRSSRSSAMTCEVLATESLGKPVVFAGKSTLPGASTQTRLLVNGTQTTVRIRLRLSASPWTTTTGRRKPGPDPVGLGRSAQYTWPWEITIRRLRECVAPHSPTLGQAGCRQPRKHDSSPRLRRRDRGVQYIQSRPQCRPDCVISSGAVKAAPLRCKPCQEWRSLFSYPKYNQATFLAQASLRKQRG